MVVLVEPNRGVRESMAEAIESLGTPVRVFERATDALAFTRTGISLAAIIVNVRATVTSPAKLVKALHSDVRTAGVPVIAMTGHHRERVEGAHAHLAKPFDLSELAHVLAPLVQRYIPAPAR
jgi:CheY-like chemotaxis protein